MSENLWLFGCQQGGEWGTDGGGIWGQQMQTAVQRRDNSKILLYSTGDYIQYSVINNNGKKYEKECIYTCIIQSLCCTIEINTSF